MRCKPGVSISRLRPELMQLFPVVDAVFWAWNKVPVVTSTYDSHVAGLHPQNLAFDLRCHHLGDYKAQLTVFRILKQEIESRFPHYYDVLFECAQTPNAHFHIEAAPFLLGLLEGSAKEVAA